ncbi:MAG: hypothetical protein EXS47_01600 [Candidatus Zambryskibacteria bacterium]|nr:hypothetical protein [Candidatus Zambryskibacteria bacterium]
MIGILIYLAILILGLSFVIFRDQTSLLKGKSFLKFNLVFFAVTFLVIVITRQLDSNLITIYSLLIVLIMSVLVRKKWFLFKYNFVTTSLEIEDCLSKILMSFQKSGNGYIIKVTEGSELLLNIVSLWPKCAILSLNGNVHQKKVEILENFIVKKFSSIFPKLVIKLK